MDHLFPLFKFSLGRELKNDSIDEAPLGSPGKTHETAWLTRSSTHIEGVLPRCFMLVYELNATI